MKSIKKCVKEWNAVIEALGHGKQIILIRKYAPSSNEFLLYPTFSYTRKNDYPDFFKEKYWKFISKYALPNQTDKLIEIKYFAKVHEVIEMPYKYLWKIDEKHLWTENHVKDYLKGKPAKIWVLRVYKLEKPHMVKKTKGMLYGNLEKGIELEGMNPIINKFEFLKEGFKINNDSNISRIKN